MAVRRIKRASFGAVLGLVVSVALEACSSSDAGGGKGAGAPIKIGNISIISSPVTAFPQVKTGVRAAVDELNAKGGVNGRKLELVLCNDKFDPNVAITCAQQMVQQNVAALVGSLSGQAT